MQDIQLLNEAIDVVNSMSRDPKVRELIRQREFAEHEKASRMAEAEEKGVDKLSKKLIAMGVDEATIQKAISELKSSEQ